MNPVLMETPSTQAQHTGFEQHLIAPDLKLSVQNFSSKSDILQSLGVILHY